METLKHHHENDRDFSVSRIPGMFYQLYPDGSMQIISGSETVCGYSDYEFNCQSTAWTKLIHPDAGELLISEKYNWTGKEHCICKEYRIIAKDGSTRWVSDRKTSFFNDEGCFEYACGVIFDVTERKRLQEEDQQMAEAANRAKSTFMAGMSHDIKNSLGAVVGLSDLLSMTDLDVKQREYAKKIKIAASFLNSLMNDILDISKMEAGKIDMTCSEFNLDETLDEAACMATSNRSEKDPAQMRFRVDPRVPRSLKGDALRLRQVLVNLLDNAVKFAPKGEIILSVRVANRSENKLKLQFSVRDSGIGINEEHKEKIFQPFYQAAATETAKYGGTGLGLAISKRLVEMMEGDLMVESIPGGGSEFIFTASFRPGSFEDREKAFQSGMDDINSKPVKSDVRINTPDKWTGQDVNIPDSFETGDYKTVDWPKMLPMLDEMKMLLERGDMDAVSRAGGIRSLLSETGLDDQLNKLVHSLAEYDSEKAMEQLDLIIQLAWRK